MKPNRAELVSRMSSTSASLLERVKARDEAAWGRLALSMVRWSIDGRKAGIQANDAQDVVQNVFVAVDSDIHKFDRSRVGDSFRGWLWTICRHKVLDHFREKRQGALASGGTTAQQRLQQFVLPEPGAEQNAEMCRLRHRAVAMLRDQFENHVWEAFLVGRSVRRRAVRVTHRHIDACSSCQSTLTSP